MAAVDYSGTPVLPVRARKSTAGIVISVKCLSCVTSNASPSGGKLAKNARRTFGVNRHANEGDTVEERSEIRKIVRGNKKWKNEAAGATVPLEQRSSIG